MNDENTVTKIPMTVLCVDDELDILQSMKRLLHKKDYHLLLATSGAKALELLQQNDVHLIITDMRMPSMSGAELLEKIATSYPDTYRILLTGFADMESTVNAINKGKIHRYLQKPWDNDELISAIEEGLEKVRLKCENISLQKQVANQNKRLKELNQNLEDKVQLRTEQIYLALDRIERNNNATQKVLYNMININPNLNGGFANSVSQLSKKIAEHLLLPKDEIKDITYSALICEIGLLGLDTDIYKKPFSELNYNQQKEYLEQTKTAELILVPAIHLQAVSEIITYQFEWYNGQGPQKLVDSKIPIGAKILSVARDYWRYALGKMTPHHMKNSDILAEMKKFTGTRYDPNVLEILFNSDDIKATLSGRVNVDYHWLDTLLGTQFKSVLFALVLVWFLVCLSLKSLYGGILAVIPVVLACLSVYAFMGVVGITLAVGTSMTAAIALGIGVDFSIHTLDRIKLLITEQGVDPDEALHQLFPSTGRALLFSFVAVFVGFGILGLSNVPPLSKLGMLIAFSVLISFISSMTVLPALIKQLKPTFLGYPKKCSHCSSLEVVKQQ